MNAIQRDERHFGKKSEALADIEFNAAQTDSLVLTYYGLHVSSSFDRSRSKQHVYFHQCLWGNDLSIRSIDRRTNSR